MSNLTGKVVGVYVYKGKEVYKVRFPKSANHKDIFVDTIHQPIEVTDERLLETLKIEINGELKSPWTFY